MSFGKSVEISVIDIDSRCEGMAHGFSSCDGHLHRTFVNECQADRRMASKNGIGALSLLVVREHRSPIDFTLWHRKSKSSEPLKNPLVSLPLLLDLLECGFTRPMTILGSGQRSESRLCLPHPENLLRKPCAIVHSHAMGGIRSRPTPLSWNWLSSISNLRPPLFDKNHNTQIVACVIKFI